MAELTMPQMEQRAQLPHFRLRTLHPRKDTRRTERMPDSQQAAILLLCAQNRVLCRLGDSEFDDGFGWNLDLLLRLRIEADASLPLLLYELAKTGQDEFAVLFHRFVGDVAECIEEYSSGSFVGYSL
jgi:hypothetical protein